MKIALYVSELDVKGGTHKQVLRLAQYLENNGHLVQIFTPTFEIERTFPEFAKLDVVALYNQRTNSRINQLFRRLAALRLVTRVPRVDVVNIHDNGGILFFFICWLLRRSDCYVWQINDLHHSFRIGNSSKAQRRWHHPFFRVLNKLMAQMVDRITVNVGKNVTRVKEHLQVNADLLHCGVDIPEKPLQSVTDDTLPFRVLSTGVFFSYRNYERLVEACFEASNKSGQSVELTIVGNTRSDPEYARNVQELANEKCVPLTIRENLSEEELDIEISRCHVFVFVNIDQSWGLAVFETAARKKAVILSTSVGAAEILTGKPGFKMVDPTSKEQIGEALLEFIKNPTLCKELGSEAAETVKNMTWENMYCSKVGDVFKEVAVNSQFRPPC